MRPVERSEILDLGAYEQIRERFRARVIELKRPRRLAVGEHLTFIWENRDTVLFQIQEMLRTERITSSSAVLHELSTYNELLPEQGELSATLMIEYDDPAERKAALDAFASLRREVTLQIGDRKVVGEFRDQPGEEPDRLPAVNYVRFRVGDAATALLDEKVDVRMVVDNARYKAEAVLSAALRKSLADDLREP